MGSSFVAGLDAATRASRSPSVERRFTNVVLPLRRVPGSTSSVRPSAWFSAAIAPNVVLVLPTSWERSSRRSAIAPIAREVSTRKRSKLASSATSCRVSSEVVPRAGPVYFSASA